MSEHIVETFGIVQEFADLHGNMNTPLYEAIMNVMLSRQREEIVRCRDCCCCHTVEVREWCVRHNITTSPDAFCAWGERRSE